MRYLTNINKLTLIAVIAVMASLFSSCDVIEEPYGYDDPWDTGLLGTWEYSYNQYGPIKSDYDIDSFKFEPDGTGWYAYYDRYGDWVNTPFTWRSTYLNQVEIFYNDGTRQSSRYYFDGGYLVFGDRYTYDAYRPRY